MSHLKLVSFTAENFDIGGVLTYADNTAVTDQVRLNEALSLYFQWGDRALTVARIGKALITDAKMDFDRDDLEPEYFWLETKYDLQVNSKTTIEIFFEVFNTAYSFVADVEEFLTGNDGKNRLYFARPKRLKVAKSRQFQRRVLDSPIPVCLRRENLQKCDVALIEVGPKAVCIQIVEPLECKSVEIEINGKKFPFRVLRESNDRAILEHVPSGLAEYISYFKTYTKFVYPYLLEKSEVDLNQVLSMYEESGFYGKGASLSASANEFDLIKKQTLDTWSKLRSDLENIVEMIVRGPNGKLMGSSCLARAFRHLDSDLWVIHHLAVITDPGQIRRTTDLYLWRIDFLLGLPTDFSVCCWYDSTSKWIDRIWTKFHRTCLSKGAYVHEIETYTFSKDENLSESGELPSVDIDRRDFGESNRILIQNENMFGGIGPQYLNASGFLNHVAFYTKPPTVDELIGIHKIIQSSSPQSDACSSYRVTVPKGTQNDVLLNRKKSNADRFCIFPSDSLPQLLSSLMHSLAVMERKHEINAEKLA